MYGVSVLNDDVGRGGFLIVRGGLAGWCVCVEGGVLIGVDCLIHFLCGL